MVAFVTFPGGSVANAERFGKGVLVARKPGRQAGRRTRSEFCRMMRLAGFAFVLMLAAAPAWSETVLRLSESATVMVPPDELDASLRAEAVSADPTDAQKRVNAMMADAVAHAKQIAGVTVSTGGYSVWRIGPTQQDRRERWQASQTLQLKGHDGAVLLKLVGELQQNGLATGQLQWRLSRAAQEKAHAEATREAITRLRGRVDEAAELLGMRFGSYKEVRLDGTSPPPPFPRLMAPAAAMAAAAPAPPQAEAEDVAVSASAEADAILMPR